MCLSPMKESLKKAKKGLTRNIECGVLVYACNPSSQEVENKYSYMENDPIIQSNMETLYLDKSNKQQGLFKN